MNKTAKIIIAILILICALLATMVTIKGNEAEKLIYEGREIMKEKIEFEARLEVQEKLAERQAALAIEAQNRANEAASLFRDCQESK